MIYKYEYDLQIPNEEGQEAQYRMCLQKCTINYGFNVLDIDPSDENILDTDLKFHLVLNGICCCNAKPKFSEVRYSFLNVDESLTEEESPPTEENQLFNELFGNEVNE